MLNNIHFWDVTPTHFFFRKFQDCVGLVDAKCFNFSNSLDDTICVHFVADTNFE